MVVGRTGASLISHPTPEQVLPHRGRMLLLSRIVSVQADGLVGEADISPQCPFADGPRGVPRWVGIEFMAQAVGAFDGLRELNADHPIMPGYLLGTRRLENVRGYFSFGSVLSISVRELMMGENGMGAYACELRCNDSVMSCQLSVYRRPASTGSSADG
jgi:predicted hotdog family 3-hydroxylacyl-ACP dehydratase